MAIINEKMANHFWPQGGAIGEEFVMGSLDDGERWRVVGIARDSKYQSLGGETPFFTYLPVSQRYRSNVALQVRTSGAGAPPLAAIRQVVDGLDPDLPFLEVVALRDYVEVGFLAQRVAGSVAGVLGVVG